jgi:hypothetical protein
MRIVRALVVGASLWAGFSSSGCGGSKDAVGLAHGPNDVTEAQIDADPYALLPGSAIVVASLDARAFFTSNTLGPQVAQLAEKYIPIGEEAGFSASRDVDRVVAAAYSTQGADVAAVVSGRFDAKKIATAAENHTPTKGGGMLVASEYAGRKLYTLNNVGFTVLTPKTALVGTETGIRRALDRIRDGRVKRDFADWILTTVETKGAALAVAADFASQPVVTASVGAISLPWLKGMRAARILGNFQEPGMQIAGTLTYGEPAQAAAAGDGLRQVSNMANLLAVTGLTPQIQNLEITPAQTDVQYKFNVDDRSLRGLLTAIPGFVR